MAKSSGTMTWQRDMGLGFISSLEMTATGTMAHNHNEVVCDFIGMSKVNEYMYW